LNHNAVRAWYAKKNATGMPLRELCGARISQGMRLWM